MAKKIKSYTYVFYAYISLMLLSILGYILLFNDRFKKADYWKSLDYLREEQLEQIQRLGNWNIALEMTFIILFLLMAGFCLIKSKKNKNILKRFLIVSTVLLTGIIGLIYILAFTLSLPTMMLLVPLFIPVVVLIGLIIYYFIVNLVLLKLRRN